MNKERKEQLGFLAFALGIIGAGFGMGGVENAQTLVEWGSVAGVVITSFMLMQLGVWIIQDSKQ